MWKAANHQKSHPLSQVFSRKIYKLLLGVTLTRFSLIMVVILHFAACFWISLGYETTPDEDTWFDRIKDLSINPSAQSFQADYFTLYIMSLFQVVVTLTTVGYGTFEGSTLREYFFSMSIELFGIMFFAFLMYKLRSTIKSLNEVELKRIEEVEIRSSNSLISYLE